MINETVGGAAQDGWEERGSGVRAAAVTAPTPSLSVAMVTAAAGTRWEPSRHTGGQTFVSDRVLPEPSRISIMNSAARVFLLTNLGDSLFLFELSLPRCQFRKTVYFLFLPVLFLSAYFHITPHHFFPSRYCYVSNSY